jgi:hypothetical protein
LVLHYTQQTLHLREQFFPRPVLAIAAAPAEATSFAGAAIPLRPMETEVE